MPVRGRFLLLLPLLLGAALPLRAETNPLQADGDDGSVDRASFSSVPASTANPNLLFRSNLTDVEVSQGGKAPTVKDLADGSVYFGQSLSLKQQVNESLSVEGLSSVKSLNQDDWSPAASLSQASSGDASAGQGSVAAKWKPIAPIVVSVSTATETTTALDRQAGKNYQSRETQEVKTEWAAPAGIKFALVLDREKMKNEAAIDSRTTTMARLSRALGKTNLTLSLGAGLRNDRPDETSSAVPLAGTVGDVTLTWTPSKVSTLSFGLSFSDLQGSAGAASETGDAGETGMAVERQSLRNAFVNWSRTLSPSVTLQMGGNYGTETDTLAGLPYWETEQGTVWIGQTVSLSETASARFDVSRYVYQENVYGSRSGESVATFSVKKVF